LRLFNAEYLFKKRPLFCVCEKYNSLIMLAFGWWKKKISFDFSFCMRKFIFQGSSTSSSSASIHSSVKGNQCGGQSPQGDGSALSSPSNVTSTLVAPSSSTTPIVRTSTSNSVQSLTSLVTSNNDLQQQQFWRLPDEVEAANTSALRTYQGNNNDQWPMNQKGFPQQHLIQQQAHHLIQQQQLQAIQQQQAMQHQQQQIRQKQMQIQLQQQQQQQQLQQKLQQQQQYQQQLHFHQMQQRQFQQDQLAHQQQFQQQMSQRHWGPNGRGESNPGDCGIYQQLVPIHTSASMYDNLRSQNPPTPKTKPRKMSDGSSRDFQPSDSFSTPQKQISNDMGSYLNYATLHRR